MFLRDLRQAHAGAAVLDDLLAIDVEPRTPDQPPFQPCAAHPGTHPFDEDAALQFRHGADDHDDCPTQRSLGVYRFPLA